MPNQDRLNTTNRLNVWHFVLISVCLVFGLRLFYLQIIKHGYYSSVALKSQLKEYLIPATRGVISAHDQNTEVPIVLNEKKWTIFADPKFVDNVPQASSELAKILGGSADEHQQKIASGGRYQVLAKKLDEDKKNQILALTLKGIGAREEYHRTYPEGSLAAQLLGFVNDEGEGKYGVEQYLNDDLKGQPGQLKAITDAKGVPLVSNQDNLVTAPVTGKRVLLTIDISMQRQLEDLLKAGLDYAKSGSGSAIIIDPNTGAIKAMANYPTYNPAEFFKVEDASLFINGVVGTPLEIGSSMKPLTVAAALDSGVIKSDSSFFDPGFVQIGDKKITNVEEVSGSGTRSIADVLQMSLNTGAVHVLKQFGGGEINETARVTWHSYLTGRYGFGQPTGIEQGYEAEGYVPDPKNGYGLPIQYANTAFGQGIAITPLQMAAAFSAVINGGNYYKPYLVDKITDEKGRVEQKKPQRLRENVVSPEVSSTMRNFLTYIVDKNNRPAARAGFSVGGKTGTAQITKPGGGYYEDRYNGTYIGFVGGDLPKYVIFVRVNEPKIGGYAGSRAAAPLFASISNMLINNFGVTPKSN